MHNATATLQKLIKVLDETSVFYLSMARRTTSSQFRFQLQRVVQTHQWIADDLVEQLVKAGGTPKRGGSLWGSLRALQSNWLMRASRDIELAYAIQAGRREAGVLRCFDVAIEDATDTESRDSLRMQSSRIERAYTQFDCFSVLTLAPAPQPPRVVIRVPGAGAAQSKRTTSR